MPSRVTWYFIYQNSNAGNDEASVKTGQLNAPFSNWIYQCLQCEQSRWDLSDVRVVVRTTHGPYSTDLAWTMRLTATLKTSRHD